MSKGNIIYVRDWCNYCDAAIKVLEDRAVPFQVEKVDKSFLQENFNANTWPQIIMWGQHIGGYTDLLRYVDECMTGGGS
tara:strand:- start:2587 stop:2823 length:237 start_codon:yes stop_codon:yes gene_type:complete